MELKPEFSPKNFSSKGQKRKKDTDDKHMVEVKSLQEGETIE